MKMIFHLSAAKPWKDGGTKQGLIAATRTILPIALVMIFSTAAHAQGTIDLSGAKGAMDSFRVFAEYAGAVICLGSLIFAGIRLMAGRFQDSIPGLFGALFGAGVLGWGAGWISSLTGQSVSMISHASQTLLG